MLMCCIDKLMGKDWFGCVSASEDEDISIQAERAESSHDREMSTPREYSPFDYCKTSNNPIKSPICHHS